MASFTETPDIVFVENIKYNTLITSFESGYEQRRAKWGSDLRSFTLRFGNRSQSEMEAIRDFFDAREGSYDSFTYTYDSVDYTVRFAEDSLSIRVVAYQIYNIETRFVEVR